MNGWITKRWRRPNKLRKKYVAGTMEGEDGFAYDGAGIYDLQENRWLRVYGNFPDERAH